MYIIKLALNIHAQMYVSAAAFNFVIEFAKAKFCLKKLFVSYI